MNMEKRIGRQEPVQFRYLDDDKTESKGSEAVEIYEKSGRIAQEWQKKLMKHIFAYNDDDLWTHTKFGYSIPRRNGKNEIAVMIELFALENNLRVLHTAHRTTTSHTAWERLVKLYDAAGHKEIVRQKKGSEALPEEYTAFKAYGLENVKPSMGDAIVNFRTRSSKGGLGEGYDILIIDEAQEYTDDQESALKYVVTDSKNPLTIMCGTPPTPVSSGTVFFKLRDKTLSGEVPNGGWAEWSVEKQSDPNDKELWYQCNPSLGTIFTERSIADEIGSDPIDFNIQRLGLWLRYNQKSAISENEWKELSVDNVPTFTSKLFVGIKYGHDNTNVSMSIAVKTVDERIFVEGIDCRPAREGNQWIIDFLEKADVAKIAIDGASGQKILEEQLKSIKKKAILPTVKEVIVANTTFENNMASKKLCHNNQLSMLQIVSNCDKRAIGSNGGFGYRSIRDDLEIGLMDSMILADWLADTTQDTKKKQKINY